MDESVTMHPVNRPESVVEAEEDITLTSDVNTVKSRLIEKLIAENENLLQDLEKFQSVSKSELQTLKQNAARVMERLVADNAWYRDQNAQLHQRLENYLSMEKRHRDQFSEVERQREQVDHDRRVLARYVDTLREQKTSLEFQANHLGAAFLTLREAVLQFVGNPLALEADIQDQSWEARIESPGFQSSVITTVQATSQLRLVMEGIDHRLIGLRLLDPTVGLPKKGVNLDKDGNISLTLMGEKLVPFTQVVQLKRERQMWQRRYLKQQDDLAHLRVKLQTTSDALTAKDQLVQKLKSAEKTSRSGEALRAALRTQNAQLEKELHDLRQKCSQLQKQITSPASRRSGAVGTTAPEPRPSTLSRAASSAFLGLTPSGASREAVRGDESPGPPVRQRSVRSPSIVVKQPELSQESTPPTPRQRDATSHTPRRLVSTFLTVDERQPAQRPPETQDIRRGSSMAVRTLRSPSMSHTLQLPNASAPTAETSPLEAKSSDVLETAESFGASKPLRSPSRRSIVTTVRQSEYQSPLARELHGLAKASSKESVVAPPTSPLPTETLRLASTFLEGPSPNTPPLSPTLQQPLRLASRFLEGPSSKEPKASSPQPAIRLGSRFLETTKKVSTAQTPSHSETGPTRRSIPTLRSLSPAPSPETPGPVTPPNPDITPGHKPTPAPKSIMVAKRLTLETVQKEEAPSLRRMSFDPFASTSRETATLPSQTPGPSAQGLADRSPRLLPQNADTAAEYGQMDLPSSESNTPKSTPADKQPLSLPTNGQPQRTSAPERSPSPEISHNSNRISVASSPTAPHHDNSRDNDSVRSNAQDTPSTTPLDTPVLAQNPPLGFLSVKKHGDAFPWSLSPHETPTLQSLCSSETVDMIQPVPALPQHLPIESIYTHFPNPCPQETVTDEIRRLLSTRTQNERILSKELNSVLALLQASRKKTTSQET